MAGGAGESGRLSIGFLALTLVATAAVAVFLNSLGGPFLYDDVDEIQLNPRVHRLDRIPSLLTTDYWSGARGEGILYRPVLAATIPPLFLLAGGRPLLFHWANIALHAATACLLASIACRLLRRRAAALAAGLLFAVHPIHAEAVAWISGRSELSFAAFGAAAWAFHLRAREGGRLWASVAAVLCLAAALGSKESALCWPLLFLAGDALFPSGRGAVASASVAGAPRGSGPGGRFHLGLYGAYAATFLLWLAARFAVLGRLGRPAGPGHLLNPLNAEPWWPARPFTALRTLAKGIRETVLPLQECFDYGFRQIPVARGPLSADVLAALGACLLLSVLLWRRRRTVGGTTSGAILLGAVVFLIAWLPVSSLAVPAVAILAERYLYLPSFGICLALGALWGELWNRAPRRRPWLLAGGLALLLAASVSTIRRNTAFVDHLTLSGRAASNCGESAHAQYLHAGALVNAGRLGEAIAVYGRALEIDPGYVDAGADLARALARLGRIEEAARRARIALEAGPEGVFEKLAVASALASAGLGAEARRLSAEVQREHPDDQRILFLRAERSIQAGRLREALAIFERIRADLPRHPVGYVGVGRVRMKLGEFDAAREAFEEALRLDPYDPEALFNLAHLASITKPGTAELAREAKNALERYLVIRPGDALGWLRLGLASERLGEPVEAESAYRRAMTLAPASDVPRRALSGFLVRQGREEEARSLEKDLPEVPERRSEEPERGGP